MIRSPLYYSGDKFKVLKQITKHVESDARFFDLFAGGGSILANISNKEIIVNDINTELIKIHKYFYNSKSGINIYKLILENAIKWELTVSSEQKYIKNGDKKFFSKKNRLPFLKLRAHYNKTKKTLDLITLIFYSYNRLLRFNSSGEYNVPVGSLDLNTNVKKHIIQYCDAIKKKNIKYKNLSYEHVLTEIKKGDIVFMDPPYFDMNAEYNDAWDINDEKKLYKNADLLIEKGAKVLITNYWHGHDSENKIFQEWTKGKESIKLNSFYYSRHNNKGKKYLELLVIGEKNGKKI